MSSRQPPIYDGNVFKYATELTEYLNALNGEEAASTPSATLLRGQVGNESAAVDGLLMFNQTLQAPVYSYAGSWWPIKGNAPNEVAQEWLSFDTMFAQTSHTYAAGTAVEGQYWRCGDFVYRIEAESAVYADYHAVTDNGVKLTIFDAPHICPAALNAYSVAEIDGEDVTTVIEPAGDFNKALFEKMVPYSIKNNLWWFWDAKYISSPDMVFDMTDDNYNQAWWRMFGRGGLFIHSPSGADFDSAMKFLFSDDILETDNTASNLRISEFELRHWSPTGGGFTTLPFGHGLVIVGGFQIRIERLRVQWFRGSGILTKRLWDSRIYDNVIQRCGTPPTDLGGGVYDMGEPSMHCRDSDSANTNSLRIKDNQLEAPQGTGLAVGGTAVSELVTDPGDVTLTATTGSSTILVTYTAAHNMVATKVVKFTGGVSLGGLITDVVINDASGYAVTNVVDPLSFEIDVSVVANASDTGDGGAALVAEFVYITNGGGAKHCVLDGNKSHERQAEDDASNILIYGPNTDWTVVVNQQISPLEDYGVRVQNGAANTVIDNCEFGNGRRPVQIDADAGQGIRVTNSFFMGRSLNYHVTNNSLYPVFISGNVGYESLGGPRDPDSRICNFAVSGLTSYNNSNVSVELGSVVTQTGTDTVNFEPYVLKDGRTLDVNDEFYFPKLVDLNDRIIGGTRYRYLTNTDNTRISFQGLISGSLTDLLSINGEPGVMAFRGDRIKLQGSDTTSIMQVNGDPDGVVTAEENSLALNYAGGRPAVHLKIGPTGTKWRPIDTLSEETVTEARLVDETDPINTNDKYEDKPVWASDTKKLYRSSGSGVNDDWDDVAGTNSITPAP